jgi:prepilin-type N-terminal cleavage/methylation domain-containing protein
MTSQSAKRPRGYSVLEMLVSLVIGAILIAGVGAIGFRQQRFQRDVVAIVERLEQLEQSGEMLPIAIRGISPVEGDIAAGGARDTSLEFRATIVTAVVCDSGHGSLVLAPTTIESPHLASVLARPDLGDTIWSFVGTATGPVWQPRTISTVIDSTVVCAPGGLSPWSVQAPRRSITVRIAAPLPVGPGAAIRITRPWRYSIYKSSDGDWYFGAREWNSASMKFNTIQPVSGPFRSAASHGMQFRYFDSAASVIPSGATDTRAIALIQVTFRTDSVLSGRYAHAVGIVSQSITSIALRNRLH